MTDRKVERDALTGVETTGHEWDGLTELNNPAPRWWLWVLIATIVWAVGYSFAYPSIPTPGGANKGFLGWSQLGRLNETQAEIDAIRAGGIAKVAATPLGDILKDDALRNFAISGGGVAFKNNCAACHGTGGAGLKGYPNLNDNDWLWGGKIEEIHQTLKVGIRSTHPDTRQSLMPSFGKDQLLQTEDLRAVAYYARRLFGGPEAGGEGQFEKGKAIFAEQCASCHGAAGEGGREFGAPRLNDAIWLYGDDAASVEASVANAHAGVMPTWEGRLDDATLKMLAVYVHSLGGGE